MSQHSRRAKVTRLYSRQCTLKVSGSRGSLQRIKPSFHVDLIAPLAIAALSESALHTDKGLSEPLSNISTQAATSSLSTVSDQNILPSTDMDTPVHADVSAVHVATATHKCSPNEAIPTPPTDIEQVCTNVFKLTALVQKHSFAHASYYGCLCTYPTTSQAP